MTAAATSPTAAAAAATDPASASPPATIHAYMDRFLGRIGPFAPRDADNELAFAPGQDVMDFVRSVCKILVVGAGGLGCELLKDLALSGFSDVHVIDMDTIDLSNLNRQFLFRNKDIGKPKAEVAAAFINERIPGCKATPHFCKIQDKDTDFYSQFNLIITGLDSVDARRWMNATVVSMFDDDDPSTLIPIIDGGTEGFKGQARVILPKMNACYECSLDMFTKPTAFPICTIANTPRLPEHCVSWAFVLQWPKERPDTKLDGDNPDHIQWVLEKAADRANQYGIRGVTYALAQGVVKNIIPAIASTNAVISAACVVEAIKLTTNCQPTLDNYMMYTGNESVYTFTFALERKPDCPVCGAGHLTVQVPRAATVHELMDMLAERPDLQLKKPSLRTQSKSIYMQKPKQLEEATRPNLGKPLAEFVGDDAAAEIAVTDANLPLSLTLTVQWEN